MTHAAMSTSLSAPVEKVYIANSNSTATPSELMTTTDGDTAQTMASKRGLTFIEGRPGMLRCTSEGGYPAPDMLIYIGKHDITTNFSLVHRASMTGQKGLRVMSYTTERVSTRLLARPDFDGRKLQCIVTVPGLSANITTVKLKVKCEYICCDDQTTGRSVDGQIYEWLANLSIIQILAKLH